MNAVKREKGDFTLLLIITTSAAKSRPRPCALPPLNLLQSTLFEFIPLPFVSFFFLIIPFLKDSTHSWSRLALSLLYLGLLWIFLILAGSQSTHGLTSHIRSLPFSLSSPPVTRLFVFNSLPFYLLSPFSLSLSAYHCNLHVYKTRFICLVADSIGNFKQVAPRQRREASWLQLQCVWESSGKKNGEMVRWARRHSPTHALPAEASAGQQTNQIHTRIMFSDRRRCDGTIGSRDLTGGERMREGADRQPAEREASK